MPREFPSAKPGDQVKDEVSPALTTLERQDNMWTTIITQGVENIKEGREAKPERGETLDRFYSQFGGEGGRQILRFAELFKNPLNYEVLKADVLKRHQEKAKAENGVVKDDKTLASTSTGILYEFAVLAHSTGVDTGMISNFEEVIEPSRSRKITSGEHPFSEDELKSLGLDTENLVWGETESITLPVIKVRYNPK